MSIIPGKPESPAHWRYFLALENDLMQLARYIEFSKGNFSTFSMELASLLLRSGSEVDVVAKLLCKKINPRTKAKNIGHYANQIGAALPKIGTF